MIYIRYQVTCNINVGVDYRLSMHVTLAIFGTSVQKPFNCERSRNLDRSFRNIYIIPSFPTREQHAHSVQNARLRFNKLNQSYSGYPREKR